MAEASNFLATQRIAVVSGGNKGIGLEICRQLASKGIVVILTARDEKKGNEAVINMLNISNYNTPIIFHQLDVTDISSIARLKDFIKDRFGKLDILVNNAAVLGVLLDKDVIISPGNVRNEWVIGVLNDCENLTEDKVDEVLNVFLKDFKEDSLETKNWPTIASAYVLSKAALNGYTRILAKKYPNFLINCVCPGSVKTDMCCNYGTLSVEEGAESPVWLALLPQGGPSGNSSVGKTSHLSNYEIENPEIMAMLL